MHRSLTIQFSAIVLTSLTSVANAQLSPALAKKLTARVTINVDSQPLSELLTRFSESHQLAFTFDETALAAEGLHPDDPVSLNLDKVKLGQVVELAAASLNLCIIPEADSLLVTTTEGRQDRLLELPYACPWAAGSRVPMQKVVDAIEQTTTGPWVNIDGIGGEFTAVTAGGFKVFQNWAAHQEIADLLQKLQLAISGRPPAGDRFAAQIQARLNRKTDIEAESLPLADLLEQTLEPSQINYWIDRAALKDEGLPLNQEVTPDKNTKSLGELLQRTLTPLDLTAYLDREVMIITTRIAAEDQMLSEVYNISRQARETESPFAVADIIMQTPGTGSWVDLDGGAGQCVALGNFLIVRQHRFGQEKIRKMLQ